MAKHQNTSSTIAPRVLTYIDDIRLDQKTPYGLFESDQGNRYLVTGNDDYKIAITLRHHSNQAFTWQRLTRRKIATGNWLGDGDIELVHRRHKQSLALVGTLGMDEFGASLLCHPGDSDCQWVNLGDVAYSQPLTDYDGWRILKDGRVFFEQLPRCASWQKVLPVSFTPP